MDYYSNYLFSSVYNICNMRVFIFLYIVISICYIVPSILLYTFSRYLYFIHLFISCQPFSYQIFISNFVSSYFSVTWSFNLKLYYISTTCTWTVFFSINIFAFHNHLYCLSVNLSCTISL